MEPNAARFPFPLPPRTIGEEKAKVKLFVPPLLLAVHSLSTLVFPSFEPNGTAHAGVVCYHRRDISL